MDVEDVDENLAVDADVDSEDVINDSDNEDDDPHDVDSKPRCCTERCAS